MGNTLVLAEVTPGYKYTFDHHGGCSTVMIFVKSGIEPKVDITRIHCGSVDGPILEVAGCMVSEEFRPGIIAEGSQIVIRVDGRLSILEGVVLSWTNKPENLTKKKYDKLLGRAA